MSQSGIATGATALTNFGVDNYARPAPLVVGVIPSGSLPLLLDTTVPYGVASLSTLITGSPT
jgi:hypothetical protein